MNSEKDNNNKFFRNAALVAGRMNFAGETLFGEEKKFPVKTKAGKIVYVTQAILDRMKGPQGGGTQGDLSSIVKDAGKVVTAPINLIRDISKETSKAVKNVPGIGNTLSQLTDIQGHLETATRVIKDAQDLVKNVPVIGNPLSKMINVPGLTAINQIMQGHNLDEALINDFKKTVEMVSGEIVLASKFVAFVPGVGTGVAAGIGASAALIEGKPIDEAFIEAIADAIPGGAFAKAAFSIAKNAIEKKSVDPLQILSVAIEAAGGVPLPANISSAINTVNQAVQGIHIPPEVLNAATKILPGAADAIVKGKPLNEVLTNSVKTIAQQYGVPSDVVDVAKNVIDKKSIDPVQLLSLATKTSGVELPPNVIKAINIVSSAASGKPIPANVLEEATELLPEDIGNAFTTGIAVFNAKKVQNQILNSISRMGVKDFDKLAKLGDAFINKSPQFKQAGNIVKDTAERVGFRVGCGVMSISGQTEDTIKQFRNKLNKVQQKGFDLALSSRIGSVTKPIPNFIKADKLKEFSYLATEGMKGAPTRVEQMKTLASNPVSRQAAITAIKTIASRRNDIAKQVNQFHGFHGESIEIGSFE
jgi:hypothetical protein